MFCNKKRRRVWLDIGVQLSHRRVQKQQAQRRRPASERPFRKGNDCSHPVFRYAFFAGSLHPQKQVCGAHSTSSATCADGGSSTSRFWEQTQTESPRFFPAQNFPAPVELQRFFQPPSPVWLSGLAREAQSAILRQKLNLHSRRVSRRREVSQKT